jgi:YidC/Oxa1 family membrane protein insertase
MDTRRLILAMTLSFIVMYAWMLYNQKYLRQKAPATQPVAQAPRTQQAAPPQTAGPQPAISATQPAEATQPIWRVQGAPAAQVVTLGEDDPAGTCYIQAFLTSRGAAVERILVVEKRQRARGGKPAYAYAATVEGGQPYPVIEPLVLPDGRQEYSWQTASIRIGTPETTVGLSEVVWNAEAGRLENDTWQARFWVDVLQGEQPVVRIIKRFTLAPKSFAMNMDLMFQPLGQQDVSLVVDQLGAVGIRREDPRSDYRKIYVVANDDGKPKPTAYLHASLVKSGSAEIGSAMPIWWTALVDKYFAAITAPAKAVGGPRAVSVVKVFTYTTDPKAQDRGGDVAVQLISPPVTATAAAPAQLDYDLYVGPKSASIFDGNPIYAARHYAILRAAEYTWCTFSWLGEALTWFLHLLYLYIWPHNYGLAIIILVLLVRAIMHPLTKYQQVTMAQMQARQAAIQPKIAAVKQKYPNDRQKQQAETMRVYREAGINPASQIAGCLPMVIQLPIWVALYSALNYDIHLWHEPFALWIRDLSAPDALFSWSTPINIPLLSFLLGPVTKFNLLPILLAIAMYLQQKFTPKPPPAPGTSPEQIAQQQQMQKMMGFMMIFMGLLFYNMPSGLNLYIMASSAFGVLEQKRIRKHMEELRNRPQAQEPKKRHPWMDKLADMMEKRAAESHTIRKGKDS